MNNKNSLILKNKSYCLVSFAQLISIIGDNVQNIVLMWYIVEKIKSPLMASITLVVNFLPKIFLSSFAGILADKFNKKVILTICDFISCTLVFVMAIFSGLNFSLYFLILIMFLMSIVDAFFQPVSLSIIPEIVDNRDLLLANSINTSIVKVANVIGPMIGGIIAASFSIGVCFRINSISFLIAGICDVFIKTRRHISKNSDKSKISIKNLSLGFTILRKNKFLLYNTVIGGGFINFFLAPISLYIPIFIKNYLRLSGAYYGIVTTSITVGGILISIIISTINKLTREGKIIAMGYTLQGVSLILFGLSNSIYFLVISMFIFGCSLTIVSVELRTIYQREIPIEDLGKVTAASLTISSVSVPLGYVFGGYIIQKIIINHVLITTGLCVVIFGLMDIFIEKNFKYKNIKYKNINNELVDNPNR